MVGNLLTADGHLSGEGVGRCWLYMCPDPYLSVDQDIGGVGMTVSYLMQALIALLAMVVIGSVHILQSGKKTSQHGLQASDHKLNSVEAKEEDNEHLNF